MIRIQILPPEEAKKIAAGEVIDRPAALVREFIDNAIDSGASSVELAVEGGGIRKVEVSDNGSGMAKEDLVLCVKPHATSKIRSLDDLSRATTLGFRGEALAAAAAVARLEILSAAETGEAWLLETFPAFAGQAAGPEQASNERLGPGSRVRGTSVRAFGLFDAVPARKRFLKREGSEGALCRQVFIEKALAFPEITFRFVQDGRLKIHARNNAAPSGGETSYRGRFGELVLAADERQFLHEIHAAGKGFSVTVVFGGPELYRHDRRQQYVFANKRRIQDYSLIQALEYGLAGFFPNGSHPVGAVFVEVDPALADFNIHPAKREVRFADPGAIHHAVTSALVSYVRETAGRFRASDADGRDESGVLDFPGGYGSRGGAGGAYGPAGGYYPRGGETSGRLAMEALLERKDEFSALLRRSGPDWSEREPAAADGAPAAEPGIAYSGSSGGRDGTPRLVGRVFGLFIIVEKGDRIFIIDQHAAHERVLYERFLSKPIAAQELLVAIPFCTESEDEDSFLRGKKEALARLGIVLEHEDGVWRIEALPAGWNRGDGETVEEIRSLRNLGGGMTESWAASLACRAAIKDGDYLDDGAARELAAAALAIPAGRCPHGRPIWLEIGREDLFRAVRRIE
ncbi:MAG: DNA mismatch repair endonuclease MutL [Treponema sp.]|nr:DNA mismatch repair endonuclease MutL [Treponema sp.]